jgi:hypothetical protein
MCSKDQMTNSCYQNHLRTPKAIGNLRNLIILFLAGAVAYRVAASENVPYRPFAQFAEVVDKSQFVLGAVYEQSESYDIWASGQRFDAPSTAPAAVHVNQGFLALQYGITERWTLDLNVGVTTETWQNFGSGNPTSTTGLMDWVVGARYQLLNETQAASKWVPTLTFRAAGVIPGSYNQDNPFSPGLRSASIQPELLFRKHFAWSGFGSYGDGLFRWNHTTGNSQYIMALGFFQQLKCWELDLGWRHLQTLSGSDIVLNPDNTIFYPRDPRENYDALEAGVSYTTSKRHFRYGGHLRTILDGNNTDAKFWFGFSVDFPFGGKAATPAKSDE